MSHEVETMVSARVLPWHGLGKVAKKEMTAKQALKWSGLDWPVTLEPVFAGEGEDSIPVDDKMAVVRQNEDPSVLGIVGQQYVPIQNDEMFDFVDLLLDDGEVRYETAGSLRGGRVVFALVRLNREIQVAGHDEHVPYLLLANAHDGSMAFRCMTTPVRVVCMNTMRMAFGNARSQWWVRHSTNATSRVNEAKESLRLTYKYYDDFEQSVEKLVEREVTDKQFAAMVTAAFPIKEGVTDRVRNGQERRRDAVRSIYSGDTIGEFKGTAWGVINAFNEYELWYKPRGDDLKKAERQAMNVINDNLDLTNAVIRRVAK